MALKDIILTDTKLIWFIEKKLEKLAGGVYAVTEQAPDQEPLKWKIRSQALSLMSDRKNYWSVKDSESSHSVFYGQVLSDRLSGEIEKMISFLILAQGSGIISPINASIIINEYQALKKKLNQDMGSLKQALETPALPQISETHSEKEKPDLGQTIKPYFKSEYSQNQAIKKDPSSPDPKAERKVKIKSFLATVDWASIKDLANHISDCSIKTIQRELIELVERGEVKKTGERRWSRYALAGK